MADDVHGVGEMIRLARSGDPKALGQALEHYRPYLRVLAERQVGPALARRVGASDIVQQTFLEAQRDFGRFLGASGPELMAWLSRILDHNVAETIRNQALAAKRAIGREEPLGGGEDGSTLLWKEPASPGSSPSQRAMRGEEAALLARALDTLPEDQREAVRLRHLEGCPLAQIAEQLGRSPAAAAGLIKRGLQALRGKLAPYR
jgi:RNA polymerase sigma-70 factor (ECF subfamily)